MSDYLIVHEIGQSAWFWSRVWGHMTAPTQHPPRLYSPGGAAVHSLLLNLPSHGSDVAGDTGEVRTEECIQAIARAAERYDLRDPVLVGHGVGGMLALLAAPLLARLPRRLALIAGTVPANGRNALSPYAAKVRGRFSSRLSLSKLRGRDTRFPRSFIYQYMCNGMDSSEITRALGYFGPLPTRVMEAPVHWSAGEIPCPVTYVVLEQDRLVPPTTQLAMARRIPGTELKLFDACHQAPLQKPAELAQLLLDLDAPST